MATFKGTRRQPLHVGWTAALGRAWHNYLQARRRRKTLSRVDMLDNHMRSDVGLPRRTDQPKLPVSSTQLW